jgi:alkylation response protein AidB-like acyl-CoA dehydrogenase
MVLAKVADPADPSKITPGVKGISLFIVPKYKVNDEGIVGEHNDISLGGLNKKMGWRGATNCVLNYGENGNCVGELMGAEGKGLAVMFNMMNEARISVGLIASALGYNGYATSLNYARERRQGRHADSKDPAAPQVPIVEHADVKRMLLVQKAYVEGSISLCLYASFLVDSTHFPPPHRSKDEVAQDGLLLDLLTPIVKSWPSEWCLEANKWAIQVRLNHRPVAAN